jgi:hypothetical protein
LQKNVKSVQNKGTMAKNNPPEINQTQLQLFPDTPFLFVFEVLMNSTLANLCIILMSAC